MLLAILITMIVFFLILTGICVYSLYMTVKLYDTIINIINIANKMMTQQNAPAPMTLLDDRMPQ